MTWINILSPIVGEATKKVSFADAVINNLGYLKAQAGGSGGGSNLIPNGDFEQDVNLDGIPDGWDLTEYTAGAFAVNTATPGQGAKGIMFTSPGASGGGDLQLTDFFPVSDSRPLFAHFTTMASVAGIHNLVEIRWYTTALEANYISTSTVYDSVDNPLVETIYNYEVVPPPTARFAKMKLIGAQNDVATAGIAYFDDASIDVAGVSIVAGGTSASGAGFHTGVHIHIDGANATAGGRSSYSAGIQGSRTVTIAMLDDAAGSLGSFTVTLGAGTWFIKVDWTYADGTNELDPTYGCTMDALAIRTP